MPALQPLKCSATADCLACNVSHVFFNRVEKGLPDWSIYTFPLGEGTPEEKARSDLPYCTENPWLAMGYPLSPVVANLFMEEFEEKALAQAYVKPKIWLRYVDDTFVIWSHGREKLNEFLEYLNSINIQIRFTMETEKDKKLAFLDVLVERKGNDWPIYTFPQAQGILYTPGRLKFGVLSFAERRNDLTFAKGL